MSYKRKTRFVKKFSFFFLFLMLFQMFAPTNAYALTSGPSQPEVQSFEPFGTSEMVDLFSGDFTYNIPLFELPGPNGGYPFNLAYHSGVGMDQEASWVGLGWSLNPGAINRNMRGLPDDFNGDEVIKKQSIEDNWTLGIRGGFNLETASADWSKGLGGFGGSFGIYYNSYKGVGVNFGSSVSGHSGPVGFGLNLSSDSQGGGSLTPSLSLSQEEDDANFNYSLSASLNSKSGLSDINLDAQMSEKEFQVPFIKKQLTGNSVSAPVASLSFSQSQFVPNLDMPKWGMNFSLTMKLGGDGVTINPNGFIGGYFNTEVLQDKNKEVPIKSYGYLHLEKDTKKDGLLDFNREKDGMINMESHNLATPILTYDAYNIQGQGVSGTFRPYKSSAATVYNRKVDSYYGGGGSSLELGFGQTIKVGLDFSANYSQSYAKNWKIGEEKQTFLNSAKAEDFEENYYKLFGEQTFEDEDYYASGGQFDIGGKDPVDPYLTATDKVRESINGSSRKPRNQVVQSFTNKEIKTGEIGSNLLTTVLPEFDVSYKVGQGEFKVNRTDEKIKDHIAGFTILNPQGSRYNYGLPVYNTKQEDCIFSVTPSGQDNNDSKVNNTFSKDGLRYYDNGFDPEDPLNSITDADQSISFLDKTSLPKYTTTHLLTSVLGADYVDITGNGPSDDDFGYWVKFNYEKKLEGYKWRAPYNDFNYIKGTYHKISDDKASYMYGERELFYISSVETKTHEAVFHTSARKDAKGASGESGIGIGTSSSFKLDKIDLKTKGGEIIKSVKFDYSYDLTKDIANNVGGNDVNIDGEVIVNAGGKLTLKKVWFENKINNKGKLNPYYFDYDESNPERNPDYEMHNYDRWGNYKDNNESDANILKNNVAYSYVDQSNDFNKDGTVDHLDEALRNDRASAWSMRRISTPSGSDINVEYEADDYTYVQNKEAGQMFKIVGLGFTDPSVTDYEDVFTNPIFPKFDPMRLYEVGKPKLFKSGVEQYRRVYFELEEPTTNPNLNIDSYFEGVKNPDGVYQIYYSLLMNLRKRNETVEERVSGYAEILEDKWGVFVPSDESVYQNFTEFNKVDNFAKTASGEYKYGYFTLAHVEEGMAERVHPFALASWQFLRTNLSDLSTIPGNINGSPGTSKTEMASKGKQLFSLLGNVKDIFSDYYLSCRSKKWATHLANFSENTNTDGSHNDDRTAHSDTKDSWVRLTAPDNQKYGGGIRVKQITINDNWTEGSDVESEYGSVYEYKLKNGLTSGVAQNEPSIGSDESSLKWARYHKEKIPLRSNNNLFFEYPINESLYPGASVGYSRVVVKSLATDKVIKGTLDSKIPTTGQVVNKFYTAKDFPVITKQTGIKKEKKPFTVPIPFIGMVTGRNLNAHQGYSIELNDMHGRPLSVHFHAQNSNGQIVDNEYTAYTIYKYKHDGNKTINGVSHANVLNNTINKNNILTADNVLATNDMELGVEYDYYRDSRVTGSISSNLGVNLNSENMIFGPVTIPAFFPWPNGGYSETILRTLTSNKVIHRSGILESTETYDGYSSSTTWIDKYDAETGRALLTVVENEFDDPIFSYNMPAHWAYNNMGTAYKNIGMEFNGAGELDNSFSNPMFKYTLSANVISKLNLGDELILYDNLLYENPHKVYVELLDKTNNNMYTSIHEASSVGLENLNHFMVSRSGKRNLLNADAGNIVSLKNPIYTRPTENCEVDVSGINITQETRCDAHNPYLVSMVALLNEMLENGDYYTKTSNTRLNLFTDPYYNSLPEVIHLNTKLTSSLNPDGSNNPSYGHNYIFVNSFGLPKVCHSSTAVGTSNVHDMLFQDGQISTSDIGLTATELVDLDVKYDNNLISHYEIMPIYDCRNFGGCNSPSCWGSVIFNCECSQSELRIHYYTDASKTSIDHLDLLYFSQGNGGRFWEQMGIHAVSQTHDVYTSKECPENIPIEKINKVISSTAVKYSDTWLQDYKDVYATYENGYEFTIPQDELMYAYGQKGIWRPFESYVYLEDRIQENTYTSTSTNNLHASIGDDDFASEVDISADGVYNNMPVFQWDNSYFLDCEETKKWTLTNTMTKYSPFSFELENKDPLNNYSSALYGYGGKLSIGVANNSEQTEIGFESFEEYEASNQTINGQSVTNRNNSTGNIDIVPSILPQNTLNTFDVKAGTDNIVNLFKTYENSDANISSVTVEAVYPNSSDNITVNLDVTEVLETNGKLGFVLSNNPNPDPALNGECWSGKITIREETSINHNASVIYTATKAHTGKNSVKIDNWSGFTQQSLKLEDGEAYLFSAWISRDNTDVWSYSKDPSQKPTVLIAYLDDDFNIISASPTKISASGQIIDGWQKMEGKFVMPAGASRISIILSAGDLNYDGVNEPYLSSSTIPTYFDDIRIQPFDGALQTYVYDKDDFKLNAVLDANNFATIYEYNPDGSLFLVKKETEEGIKSIQESRNHIKAK